MEWIEICNKLTLGFPAKRKNHFPKISHFPRNFFATISLFFAFRLLTKNSEIFALFASICFAKQKMRKFRENKAKILRKNGIYAKKKRTLRKIQNFQKPLQQNFSEKVAKIHQKRLNFENKRLIFKERFIHEHNCSTKNK